MSRLKIGIAQFNPTVGDFSGNLKQILNKVRQADRAGLDLVIFSELALSGYPVWDLANKKDFVAAGLKSLGRLKQVSRKLQVAIVVGFIGQGKRGGKSTNSLAIIHRGKIIHKHTKILLPTYDVFLEKIFFESGNEQKVFSFKGVKIAASICEDIWEEGYARKPIQQAARSGAKLLINISASPFHRRASKARHDLISRKARKHGIAIVYVNQVGGQDDLIFDGQSLAVDERGSVFFQAPTFIEDLYWFDWAPRDRKKALPPLSHKIEEQTATAQIYKALVVGVRDYVRKNNFKQVVLGLSGGVDSALAATVARDALGADAVLGLMLPGPFSSRGSVRDAKALAHNLGIQTREISINPQYQAFKRKKKFGKLTTAEENLQARLRALELMYVSNKEGRLLLTTGNKSEMAMGYCTLYGDMCGGLGVLGDVYKTEVYRLCRWRNNILPAIPMATLQKAPTAELRPNQKDEDSLPPYEILDEILDLYIEQNKSVGDIKKKVKGKISLRVVERVIHQTDNNEYKRRQSPPVLRISEKAWFGRRMPLTNAFRGK